MANLGFILEEIEALTPAERITVLEKITSLMRADLDSGVAAAARIGAVTGVRKGTGDLVGDPYNMKGEGA